MVRIHKVFDYRQAETCTARVSGTCFIHSVETFENPGDTFFRDAYTSVAYIYMNIVFGHFHRYVYSAAFACVVYRIGDRLNPILLNLVANSINYTGEGGRIDISMEVTEYDVHIYISDTGIGIPEESVPRVFERFYRVDKARSRNSGGTGLGLAVVKHLVDSHHGDIKVDSIEGEGTTFTVTFPIQQT